MKIFNIHLAEQRLERQVYASRVLAARIRLGALYGEWLTLIIDGAGGQNSYYPRTGAEVSSARTHRSVRACTQFKR